MNHSYVYVAVRILFVFLSCSPLVLNSATAAQQRKSKTATTKYKAALSKFNAFQKKVKSKPYREEQATYAATYTADLNTLQASYKAMLALGASATPPPNTPWSTFSAGITWKSKIDDLNKELDTLAKGVRGKLLTIARRDRAKNSITKLEGEIKAAGGTPHATWAELEGTLRDPKPVAQAHYAKAIKIKMTLGSKSLFQEDIDRLTSEYGNERKLAVAYDPSLADKLPAAKDLAIKAPKPDDGSRQKRQLKTLVTKLKAINKMLSGGTLGLGGVTHDEADQQTKLFKGTYTKAKDLEAQIGKITKTVGEKLTGSLSIPELTTSIKYVSPAKAAEKYIDAIKKIDAKLTGQTTLTRLKKVTEKQRITLITQRDALVAKVEKLGPEAAALLPPKPREANINNVASPTTDATPEATEAGSSAKKGDGTAGSSAGNNSNNTSNGANNNTNNNNSSDGGHNPSNGATTKSTGSHNDDDGRSTTHPNGSAPTTSTGGSSSAAANSGNIIIKVGDSHGKSDRDSTTSPQQQPGFFARALAPSPMMGMPMGGGMGMGMAMGGGMGMGMGGGMGMQGGMGGYSQAPAPTINVVNSIGGAASAAGAGGTAIAGGGGGSGAGAGQGANENTGATERGSNAVPSKSDFVDLVKPTQALSGITIPTIQSNRFDELLTFSGCIVIDPTATIPPASNDITSSWQAATTAITA
ncbi:MAG: hypothetical protein QG604_298 [Candidatus Dependentiae bacterium]|nr:hypothetical protein [Candidatus Dependentiae bacterium]